MPLLCAYGLIGNWESLAATFGLPVYGGAPSQRDRSQRATQATAVAEACPAFILDRSDIIRRPRRDSNAQPTDSKSGALSIELRGRFAPSIADFGRIRACPALFGEEEEDAVLLCQVLGLIVIPMGNHVVCPVERGLDRRWQVVSWRVWRVGDAVDPMDFGIARR
jgi:hypothetical protein